MGNLFLYWSPIQLRLANQAKVLPIGRLSNVIVDVEGLRTHANFEVINIVDDTNPYPCTTRDILGYRKSNNYKFQENDPLL